MILSKGHLTRNVDTVKGTFIHNNRPMTYPIYSPVSLKDRTPARCRGVNYISMHVIVRKCQNELDAQ